MVKELLGEGEIIVPPLGWVSDISSVAQLGMTPVFVDISFNNLAITAENIKRAITPKTKAIVLIHCLGFNGINDEIIKIAKDNNLILIEDCCESHGAMFGDKKIGSIGDISLFSLTNENDEKVTIIPGLDVSLVAKLLSEDELKTMWQCSHAEASDDEVHKQILPDDNSLGKTKWKSIITVEPKKFFNKYLSQYPSDTRAVQPVVVFSHKPLKHFDELSDVCKVIDIAIVPDKPGVCVAVTETYHDVAS
jgi:hypothetical protein